MFQRLTTGNLYIPPNAERLTFRSLEAHEAALDERDDTNNANSNEVAERVPDGFGRVFHPTILGQELIAATSMMLIFLTRNKDIHIAPPKCVGYLPWQGEGPPYPSCDSTAGSGLPSSVFDPKVYSQFCEAVEKDSTKDVSWIVDYEGNRVPIRKEKTKRASGSDPFGVVGNYLYNDYRITLHWEPYFEGDGACQGSCTDAFSKMARGICESQVWFLFEYTDADCL